jgi:hypothetical protein
LVASFFTVENVKKAIKKTRKISYNKKNRKSKKSNTKQKKTKIEPKKQKKHRIRHKPFFKKHSQIAKSISQYSGQHPSVNNLKLKKKWFSKQCKQSLMVLSKLKKIIDTM